MKAPALTAALLWVMVGPVEAAPKALVDAIIHVESKGNASAVGRAGEIGLMQIKLQTAKGLGYRGTRKGLFDPATNVRWGSLYLDQALRRANGNLCHAASLYQSGIAGKLHCSKYGRKVVAAMK